jgi:hypothetical protein
MSNLNEQNSLNNPQTFIKHLEKLLSGIHKNESNPFPVDVFPNAIQEIIYSTNKCLNFPIDFISSSLLYAVSVSIGNTVRVEMKRGWQENVVLYLALVGRAGTNKSHPISFALKPIELSDNFNIKRYNEELIKYNQIVKMTKKERDEQGISEPIKPVCEHYIVSDFTPESLAEVHKNNKKGIGVYADELASWFKNFNRYNKGSEEQFWLSNWSGKAIRINRKTSESTYIPLPFISVIGTIQTGVLNDLANNRTENGFLDRILFVVPDSLKKEYWTDEDLEPEIIDNWQKIIDKLINLPLEFDEINNPIPKILKFTPEAKKHLFEWQKEMTDLSNMSKNDVISGTISKIETYAIRFSLLIQMIYFACNKGNDDAISLEALKGALKLVEYYKKTALKVHHTLCNSNPLDKFPMDKQNLYSELPESFTTEIGLQVANKLGIAERTFKDFLNQDKLFKRIKRGEYEKKI